MIRVVVVEDEPIVLAAHCRNLASMDGFEVVATAESCRQAQAAVLRTSPDLVLLDMRLPDGHGLELLHRLRAAGQLCDVIAVTSVREVEVVRRSMALGITHYLIKPFPQELFVAKLENYRAYHQRLATSGTARESVAQDEVDRLFSLRTKAPVAGARGISTGTLAEAVRLLERGPGLSALEVAEELGLSRVTARRYLEHLVSSGRAERSERHGNTGRPEIEYRALPR